MWIMYMISYCYYYHHVLLLLLHNIHKYILLFLQNMFLPLTVIYYRCIISAYIFMHNSYYVLLICTDSYISPWLFVYISLCNKNLIPLCRLLPRLFFPSLKFSSLDIVAMKIIWWQCVSYKGIIRDYGKRLREWERARERDKCMDDWVSSRWRMMICWLLYRRLFDRRRQRQ